MLVHVGNPHLFGQRSCHGVDGLTTYPYLAFIGLIDTGQDIHERGFPGPVLADQTVNLAWCQAEIHMVKCTHTGERLDDVA